MKLNTFLAVPAILAALLLSACGEKATEATDAAAGAATEAATEAVDAAAGAATEAVEATAEAAGDAAAAVAAPAESGGGYEPTAEERIPGETRPVEAAPAS